MENYNRKDHENHAASDQYDPQLQSLIQQTVLHTLLSLKGGEQPAKKAQKPENAIETVDLLGLFFFVMEKFWCVLLSALICCVAFGWYASKAVPTYTATAKLYIVDVENTGLDLVSLQLSSVLTMDYQEVFKTWEVHEMVREELDLPYTYEQLQSMVSVTNPEDTRILYITVVNTDAQMAADIANAYASAAKDFIINTMRGEQPSDFSIAMVPSTAQVTSKSRMLMLGFMLGTVAACGVLALLFILDTSPKTPEDIHKHANISTLAVLPAIKKKGKTKKIPLREAPPEGHSLVLSNFPELDYLSTESFNTLVTNLSYCGSSVRKIMITSRFASEGKSFIAMNLMRTLADMGKKVVVVDTDLRASGIQSMYGIRYRDDRRRGLSEYLSGQCQAEDAIYQTNLPNAWLMPAGHTAPNPLKLLDTDLMERLVNDLAEQYDVVLLDTPPIGILVDALAMAKFCDGAIMVVGYHQGKIAEVTEAVASLRQTGCTVLGSVLNGVKMKNMSNRHYYYHSKKYAGYYKPRKKKKW